MEGCLCFNGGGGVFFRWGASFLSGGCASWGSIGFDRGFFKKNCGIGGAPPPPTMGNPRGVKDQKWYKMTKNYVSLAPYLRNHTSYDCHLWYTCVKL